MFPPEQLHRVLIVFTHRRNKEVVLLARHDTSIHELSVWVLNYAINLTLLAPKLDASIERKSYKSQWANIVCQDQDLSDVLIMGLWYWTENLFVFDYDQVMGVGSQNYKLLHFTIHS